jgi:hypothetical protein
MDLGPKYLVLRREKAVLARSNKNQDKALFYEKWPVIHHMQFQKLLNSAIKDCNPRVYSESFNKLLLVLKLNKGIFYMWILYSSPTSSGRSASIVRSRTKAT